MVGLLEQVGMPARHIGWLLAGLPLAVFAAIGLANRTTQAAEFYVAARNVSPVLNGMAAAADWLSAASFVGIAGALYAEGNSALAFTVGGSGGFVLLAVLVAPYLRKSGAYTVPDFLALRFGAVIRAPAVAVLLACSFPLLVVQIQAFATIAERFAAVPYTYAAYACVLVIVLCVLLGGMRGLTRVQAAQYLLLAFAFLMTPVLISSLSYGVPVPMLTVGRAMGEVENLSSGAVPIAPPGPGAAGSLALIFCLATGTASMPHLLMRFLTVRSVRETRGSVGWTLAFACLVLLAAPAYAAFFKLNLLSGFTAAGADWLPDWLLSLGRPGVVKVCGVAATTPELMQSACESLRGIGQVARYEDIQVAREAVVLATPGVSGLPSVVTALLASGALAAALASACGLTLAVANALSHDLWHKLADGRAPAGRRLLVARLLVLGVAVTAGRFAMLPAPDLLGAVVWACALAAAGYFPALVLAIWWRRCNALGALVGMAAGMAVALLWLSAHSALLPAGPDAGTSGATAAAATASVLGVACGFAAAIAASLLTRAPRSETQVIVDRLRFPRGEPVLGDRPV